VLVESASKFAPGMSAALSLCAADTTVVVPARFVRSEVVAVNGLGVRYRAAAVFEREIDLCELGVAGQGVEATNRLMAEWLHAMAHQIGEGRNDAAIRRLAAVFAEFGAGR